MANQQPDQRQQENLRYLLQIEEDARARVQEADARADEIVSEAEEEARQIVEDARSKAKEKADEIIQEAESGAEQKAQDLIEEEQAAVKAMREQAQKNLAEATDLLIAWVTAEEHA